MVYLSPVGLAAAPVANQVSLLATYKEKLCRTVCSTSSNLPSATVTYSHETPTLVDSTVFVPIVASITIVTPGCNCNVSTQVITERFMVAFQGQTTVPTNVTIDTIGRTQGLIKIVCGKSNCYAINDSLTVTIGATAAASTFTLN